MDDWVVFAVMFVCFVVPQACAWVERVLTTRALNDACVRVACEALQAGGQVLAAREARACAAPPATPPNDRPRDAPCNANAERRAP